jgi:hypothetical protein
MENDRRAKLAITITKVTTVGPSLVIPSDCFMEKAQTTSSIPAKIKHIQAMICLH